MKHPMDSEKNTVEIERAWKGLVPWEKENLYDTRDWFTELLKTPKDDWELKPPEGGVCGKCPSFRPLFPESQLVIYLNKHYEPIPAFAHYIRFCNVNNLVKEMGKAFLDCPDREIEAFFDVVSTEKYTKETLLDDDLMKCVLDNFGFETNIEYAFDINDVYYELGLRLFPPSEPSNE